MAAGWRMARHFIEIPGMRQQRAMLSDRRVSSDVRDSHQEASASSQSRDGGNVGNVKAQQAEVEVIGYDAGFRDGYMAGFDHGHEYLESILTSRRKQIRKRTDD
ncbi:hypothetical protein GGI24_003752 [Coemansia furcata]|nr:hypothetical protein GGI24_003752 [Coemansia furcata]